MEIKVSGLMNGEVIIETKNIPIVCLVCGMPLGHVEYIPKNSNWQLHKFLTVCSDCFDKAGLKVKENIPYPA